MADQPSGTPVPAAWLKARDLVIAMDSTHVRWLGNQAPKTGPTAPVRLLLSYRPVERAI